MEATDDLEQGNGRTSGVVCGNLWRKLVSNTEYHLNPRLEAYLTNRDGEEELVLEISHLLIELCRDQITSILLEWDTGLQHSIEIDISGLAERNQWLTNLTTTQAETYLNLYDVALAKAQVDLIEENNFGNQKLIYKPKCKVRLYVEEGMLTADETQVRKPPRSDEAGSWRVLRSTVVRTGPIRLAEFLRVYECSKCKSRWLVSSTKENYNTINSPLRCAVGGSICKNAKITSVNTTTGVNLEFCKDYQEIRVQEPINKLSTGVIPRCMNIILEDDLVDQCQPGDEVLICGTVIRRFRSFKPNDRCEAEVAMVANHIRVISDHRNACMQLTASLVKRFEDYWNHWKIRRRELEARDLLLKRFCAGVFGMHLVKLSVLLVLIGGVENTSHEIKIRGDAHLLLVGDPGTGKSQILRYASRLGTRSVLTNSVGTTNAGLTCAAVKDGGEWHLEAGALVLADRGVCLIDEFGSLRSHDRDAIHEAMEQQTISVAKAGVVCKLNARCAVIATANPKGKFDPAQSIEVNVALASPLLSRFDLIFVLLDREDEEWDSYLSDFVIGTHMRDAYTPYEITQSKQPLASQSSSSQCYPEIIEWTPEIIQAYIAHVKTFRPTLNSYARNVLTAYYQLQRRSSYREASRTTIRLLESLIRLSQAHAKLLMHDSVSIEDTMIAIILLENSLQNFPLLHDTPFISSFALNSDFLQNPDSTMYSLSSIFLEKLGLSEYKSMLFSKPLE